MALQSIASSRVVAVLLALVRSVGGRVTPVTREILLPRERVGIKDHDVFSGSYICLQGSTGISLHIDRWPSVRFKFFPTPISDHDCSGEYTTHAEWSQDGTTLKIRKGPEDAWIHNPCGYHTVDLDGWFTDNGLRLFGKILFAGCSEFSMIKAGVVAQTCFDTNNGVLDVRGRSCEGYVRGLNCGSGDYSSFTAGGMDGFNASSMCCQCGGGLQDGRATAACFDWHDSQTQDGEHGGCSWYTRHPEHCTSRHDSYNPRDKCCACGGGVQTVGHGFRVELGDLRADEAVLKRINSNLTTSVEELQASLRYSSREAQALRAASNDLKKALAAKEHVLEQVSAEAEELPIIAMELRGCEDDLAEKATEQTKLLSIMQDVYGKIRTLEENNATLSRIYEDSQSHYSNMLIFMVIACVLSSLCAVVVDRMCCTRLGLRPTHDARIVAIDDSLVARSPQSPDRETSTLLDEGL